MLSSFYNYFPISINEFVFDYGILWYIIDYDLYCYLLSNIDFFSFLKSDYKAYLIFSAFIKSYFKSFYIIFLSKSFNF